VLFVAAFLFVDFLAVDEVEGVTPSITAAATVMERQS
jgi:hypothetical protein